MKLTIETNPITAIREALANRRQRLKKEAHEARRDALLERANMTIYQWNTRAIKATDSDFMVEIGSAYDQTWGDCVALAVHLQGDGPGVWRPAHFSPAKARLIAERLLMMAEYLEEEEPTSMRIDHPKTEEAA